MVKKCIYDIKAKISQNVFDALTALWHNFDNNLESIIGLIKEPVSKIVKINEPELNFCPFRNEKSADYKDISFFVYWNKPIVGGAGVYIDDWLYVAPLD